MPFSIQAFALNGNTTMPDSYADQFDAMLYALEQEERRKAEGLTRRSEEPAGTCRDSSDANRVLPETSIAP
jgi:hypothetical protein